MLFLNCIRSWGIYSVVLVVDVVPVIMVLIIVAPTMDLVIVVMVLQLHLDIMDLLLPLMDLDTMDRLLLMDMGTIILLTTMDLIIMVDMATRSQSILAEVAVDEGEVVTVGTVPLSLKQLLIGPRCTLPQRSSKSVCTKPSKILPSKRNFLKCASKNLWQRRSEWRRKRRNLLNLRLQLP
jgi:hypothetical protein